MAQKLGQEGFTLVELLVAMAIFSFVLVIVTAGFVQIIRIHQSGIASRATQQQSRLVMDSVIKDIRQSGTAAVGGTAQLSTLCLTKGSQTLEYAVDINGDLRVGTIAPPAAGVCPAAVFTSAWRTLNDTTGQVTQFAATTTPAVTPGLGTAMVVLTIASRNNLNALNATKTACLPGSGAQFCAVTTLSSGAALRGGDGL
ncbi:MAG TPA: prepilin-type N-terminal cleavage/methylation domain-containing protein [Candidatus Saccharimonas sp.]|nr:prepilin-type N-terminal cleavage/methylation domain-containing protein [Candidatus Saccharimonas sp.]